MFIMLFIFGSGGSIFPAHRAPRERKAVLAAIEEDWGKQRLCSFSCEFTPGGVILKCRSCQHCTRGTNVPRNKPPLLVQVSARGGIPTDLLPSASAL
jgi:hypothetical protein